MGILSYGRIRMSIGSTRKIESVISAPAKTRPLVQSSTAGRQFVEDIDTTNNVLVRDESEQQGNFSPFDHEPSKNRLTDFNSATADVSTSLEALALTNALDDKIEENKNNITNSKINIYNNNQSIIKDEEVERTGRSYLKHFYEKNEHLIDVDELV